MADRPSLPLRLLARSVGEVQRAQRALGHVQSALYGFVQTALDDEERARLTPLVYDHSPHGLGTALYEWEPSFFDEFLPPAPARLLLPACGAGREAHALAGQGYTVDAFDPARRLLALLERRNDAAQKVRANAGSFADLVAAASGLGPLAGFVRPPYDAVLFGWSALAHVLSAAERLDVVLAAHAMCPHGPLLLTVPAPPFDGQKPKAMLWGERLGQRRRGTTRSARGVYFLPWAGFLSVVDDAEPDGWAAATGRTAVRLDDETGPLRVVLKTAD